MFKLFLPLLQSVVWLLHISVVFPIASLILNYWYKCIFFSLSFVSFKQIKITYFLAPKTAVNIFVFLLYFLWNTITLQAVINTPMFYNAFFLLVFRKYRFIDRKPWVDIALDHWNIRVRFTHFYNSIRAIGKDKMVQIQEFF